MAGSKDLLAHAKFALTPLEFISLIGGSDVISSMSMISLYPGRRWLGWYNNPGSLDIARRLAKFAHSLSKHPYGIQPSTPLLGFDGKAGPHFIAAFSRRQIQTGHFGHLVIERSKELTNGLFETITLGSGNDPVSVILLDLGQINLDSPLPLFQISYTLLALIPITVSVAACLLCASVSDWYIFSIILIGILTHGFTNLVIGSGRLTLESPRRTAPESPPRNGILTSGDTVVVVRGGEVGINAITRGRFKLEGGKQWQISIWLCSLLHFVECLTQFIAIPQGTLFGQILLAVSVSVSWIYSFFLASSRKKLQAKLLFTQLGEPKTRGFRVGNRTAMAVFVCLLLFRDAHHLASSDEYNRVLSALLLHTTPVWRVWKDKVVEQLGNMNDMSLSHLKASEEDGGLLSKADQSLLRDLLEDAAAAFQGYFCLYKPPYITLKES